MRDLSSKNFLAGPSDPPESQPKSPAVHLEDRYTVSDRTVYLTGSQALVRLLIEQARRDRAAGASIGNFITGYPGSPLGGYDTALAAAGEHL